MFSYWIFFLKFAWFSLEIETLKHIKHCELLAMEEIEVTIPSKNNKKGMDLGIVLGKNQKHHISVSVLLTMWNYGQLKVAVKL